jgi:hypothetical protein
MKSHPDFSLLLGTAAFIYFGYKQFYLRQHVDRLERAGELSSDAAIRIRKKPMRLIGWICITAGLLFAILAFFGS